MAKAKIPTEEKLEKQEFDLFEALKAIDKKDYGYFDRLTPEQQKLFVPYMLIKWFSYVTSNNKNLERYYVMSADQHINKYLFNEKIAEHPKLVWLMLCSASPKMGFVKRQWIPQIKEKVSQLRESAKLNDIKDYYTKTYPNTENKTISEISELYVREHKKKVYLAEKYPTLKYDEIELLSNLVTESDIQQDEQENGN